VADDTLTSCAIVDQCNGNNQFGITSFLFFFNIYKNPDPSDAISGALIQGNWNLCFLSGWSSSFCLKLFVLMLGVPQVPF
jgi:hypothetical protein